MVVRMVLHIVKFDNGFPRKGGVKHFSPGEIVTGRRLHADDLCLVFRIYCQVAENVEPRNSLAPCTRGAISLGSSGNLSGGQIFLALDTGHTIVRHQWVALPMPPAIIARVNLLGKAEPSLLTFTDWHGREIGDYAKEPELVDEDDAPATEEFIEDVIPAVEITGVDDPTGEPTAKLTTKPTGVEVEDTPQASFEDGLGEVLQETETAHQPTDEPTTALPDDPAPGAIEIAPPCQGMAARNARSRKPPATYVPSMKGKKYAVAMTQIATSLGTSKNAMALTQMSVKLMPKGEHRRRADLVGMIMAQLSMNTAIKKWGEQAKLVIFKEIKQMHWRNSYKPCHWHSLSKKQKEQILESHIFVEQKRDGIIKARKVIGGNKQRDYITKEDVCSPTVTAEALMLTCVIDAQEGRDVAVVDISKRRLPKYHYF
jgi:hypothetical protein